VGASPRRKQPSGARIRSMASEAVSPSVTSKIVGFARMLVWRTICRGEDYLIIAKVS
jgi:hypothetical protein